MASPVPEAMNWNNATAYCGRIGWRLPTKDDLLALYEAKKASAALARYDGMGDGWYWSSTSVAGFSSYAWYVYFDDGRASNVDVGFAHRVRCVR